MAHDGTDKHSLTDLLDMPLAFLGFALWRAWVSLTYANPSVPMPVSGTAGQFAYDVMLAGSAIRHRPVLQPHRAFGWATLGLWGHRSSAWVLRGGRTWRLWHCPQPPTPLLRRQPWPAGIGSALLILLWCEIYSCLSPTRVALYYALAITGGVVLTFVLQGFSDEYLYGALLVLPALCGGPGPRS